MVSVPLFVIVTPVMVRLGIESVPERVVLL